MNLEGVSYNRLVSSFKEIVILHHVSHLGLLQDANTVHTIDIVELDDGLAVSFHGKS